MDAASDIEIACFIPRDFDAHPRLSGCQRTLWSFPRIDYDFRDPFLLVAPDLIHIRRLLQRNPMRNDVARIDLTPLNPLQQRLHIVVHVGLTHLHRDALAEGGSEGNLV